METITKLAHVELALDASATYNGAFRDVSTYANLAVGCVSDAGCELFLEQSIDGVTVTSSDKLTVVADTLNSGLVKDIIAPYARITVVNDTVAQTACTAYLCGKRI